MLSNNPSLKSTENPKTGHPLRSYQYYSDAVNLNKAGDLGLVGNVK